MKRTDRIPVLAALAAVVVVLSPSAAAEDFRPGELRLEQIAPRDCFLFASFAGLSACDAAAEKTGLIRIWREPEVQQFAGPFVQALAARLEQMKDENVPFEELRALLQGRVSLVLGDLTLVGLRVPMPGAVLAIDTGNRTEAFHRVLENQLGEVEQMLGTERHRFEHRGHEIHALPVPDEPRTAICFTKLENLFLIGLNKYYLQRVIDVHAEKKGAIATDGSYVRAKKRVGAGTTLLSAFLNVNAFREKLRGITPPEVVELIRETGFENMQSVYYAALLDGKGARDAMFVDAPGKRHGLAKMLAPEPAPAKARELAPYSSVYFSQMNFDLASTTEELIRLVGSYWPPALAELEHSRARFREKMGFDPIDDVISSLHQGAAVSISMPGNGGLIPEVLATIPVRHPKRFAAALEKLIVRAGGSVATQQYDRHAVKSVSLDPSIPFTPTYTIDANTCYLAGAPLVLKEALREIDDERRSLAQNPTFRSAMDRLGGDPAWIEYMDVQRVASICYATGAPFLQGLQSRLDSAGVPVDLVLLPTTQVIAKHLTPAVTSWVADESGLLWEAFSPFGSAVTLAVGARILNHLPGAPPMRQVMAHAPKALGSAAPAPDAVAETQPSRPRGAEPAADAAPPLAPVEVFQRAFDRHQAGAYDEAIAGFEKAMEMGFQPQTCAYNIACGYSLQGEVETALDWLAKSIDLGFDRRDLLAGDSDLDNLRETQRFREIVERVGKE